MPDEDRINEYELVLAFDNDDPMFARGFDMGMTYKNCENMEPGDSSEFVIRAESAEMVMRICEATYCEFKGEDAGEKFDRETDDFLFVTLTKRDGDARRE
jgi:hypothetical protein